MVHHQVQQLDENEFSLSSIALDAVWLEIPETEGKFICSFGRILCHLCFYIFVCVVTPMRTRDVVDAPGSLNNGPENDAVEVSKADSGISVFRTQMWTPVELQDDNATSKPVLNESAPYKQVISSPPKLKLKTSTRAYVRPSGSSAPKSEGEGA